LPFYGADATEIFGLDPSPKLIAAARGVSKAVKFIEGSAEASLSEIKSGHIRDAIRRASGSKKYALPSKAKCVHCVLGFKPQLRLELRGQDGQSEAEQPDHPASLGDSNAASHSDQVFGTHSPMAAPRSRLRLRRRNRRATG
jgi:hypothetical protein